MRLDLSDFNWITAVLGALILYRGIRDLYNGTGSSWRYEDEKKNFHRFYGIVSILCGAFLLVGSFRPKIEPLCSILMVAALLSCFGLLISNLCYHLSKDKKDKK